MRARPVLALLIGAGLTVMAACGSAPTTGTAASSVPTVSTSATATSTRTTTSTGPVTTSAATKATSTANASTSAGAGAVRLPPVNGRFDYQIGGPYPPAAAVAIVDRDRSAAPVPGRYNICYVNAFQTQPGEAGFWTGSHRDLLLKRADGRYVIDPDWPDEYILDTSTAARRTAIAAIVNGWIDGCAARGYQGIEPDNLDTWTRSGKRLTQADNVALATLLARHAHRRGLAIAQKNAAELSGTGKTRIGFDFAIAEECQVYRECGQYTGPYGRNVIEIEYTDNPRSAYTSACAAQGRQISVILRDREVVPAGHSGYHDEYC